MNQQYKMARKIEELCQLHKNDAPLRRAKLEKLLLIILLHHGYDEAVRIYREQS